MPDSDARAGAWPPLSIPSSAEAQAEIHPREIGGIVGQMGEAVAEATQTAPTMATLVCLAVLATCAQRRIEIAPYGDGWRETLSWWSLILADSGERKSAVMNPLTEPLHEWEKRQRDRWRTAVANNIAARETAKARIERYKADAAKARTPEDRQAAQKAMAQEIELTPEPIYVPRALVSDITSERLQQLLVENGERIALFSDEGGQFATLGGLYSNGQASFDVFLKGGDGGALSVERQQRKAYIVRAALTMCLAFQPGLFREVAGDKRMRHSGLLARWAYGNPAPRVGRRDPARRASVDSALAEAYRREVLSLMDALAEVGSTPRVLTLTPMAQEAFDAFRGAAEDELGACGRLRGLRDWGSKHPGRVLRIAALIELARRGPTITQVDIEAMLDAVAIGQRLVDHALSVFSEAGADQTEANALALLEWLRARGEPLLFTSTEATQAMSYRFRKVEQLRQAAAVLTGWGALSELKQRPNKGARASIYWLINPAALDANA